ncbi:hypothetical protein [Phaeobacter sp. 22II1-1F12B]|uniref:hypothetical protein n=1 Tax=Phaeobacter sp. 22II1-1F12B TaxID=1317111 RepID=UPI0011848FC9|nr:hypothetical protein [Phaeobacter sp. 22II1-1F12B]
MPLETTRFSLNPTVSRTPIAINNDGPLIKATNYWDLPYGKQGMCYLSGNAGNWRLLLPGINAEGVSEFRSIKRALIEPSIMVHGNFDIVACDGSPNPYCVSINKVMVDRSITKKSCRLLVYTEKGLINNVPVKVCV